jgi:hypothetical protein
MFFIVGCETPDSPVIVTDNSSPQRTKRTSLIHLQHSYLSDSQYFGRLPGLLAARLGTNAGFSHIFWETLRSRLMPARVLFTD